jgi:tRNA dimethylallyltransferase
MDYNLITVLGPTATGKTALAAQIAFHLKGEIISADSRQVYKGMNLGTGKDYEDYYVNGDKIPCYLIDVAEPEEEFNTFLFKEFFHKAFSEITARDKLPVMCGGTGLYLSTVIQNYSLSRIDQSPDENLEKLSFDELKSLYLFLNSSPHNTTDLTDKKRIITAIKILKSEEGGYVNTGYIKSYNIGVNPGREEIKKRISARLKKRLSAGMIDEVKTLLDNGLSFEKMLFFGLEYKFIALYLKGQLSYNDMFQKLNSAIQAFAKRQMTWFRKMEKEGIKIDWIESNDFSHVKPLLENIGFRST